MDSRKLMNEKISVRINKVGFIPQLRMQGPILNPIKITRAQAYSMIVAGLQVFEIDPDTNQAKELTLMNVYGEKKEKTLNAPKTQKNIKTVNPNSDTRKPVMFSGVKKDNSSKETKKDNQIPMDLGKFNKPVKEEPSDSAESERQYTSFEELPVNNETVTAELSKVENGEVVSTISD